MVHLLDLPVRSFLPMTCQGQAWMQYSQPMHTAGSITTGPSSYLVMASTGQTAAHSGYSQCMQLLRPQMLPSPSSTGGCIVNQVVPLMPKLLPRGSSFQSLQASTHWRQPMHLEASNMIARGLPSDRRFTG